MLIKFLIYLIKILLILAILDGFYDNWDDEENPYFVIIMNTDMDLSYISKYKAHLLSEGYVTTDNKTFIKESDNLKLYVDEDNESNEFIHLYVLA